MQQIYEHLQYQVQFTTPNRQSLSWLTTSFSSEDAFPKVSLSAEKLKLFVNINDSKENKNNVNFTG